MTVPHMCICAYVLIESGLKAGGEGYVLAHALVMLPSRNSGTCSCLQYALTHKNSIGRFGPKGLRDKSYVQTFATT